MRPLRSDPPGSPPPFSGPSPHTWTVAWVGVSELISEDEQWDRAHVRHQRVARTGRLSVRLTWVPHKLSLGGRVGVHLHRGTGPASTRDTPATPG